MTARAATPPAAEEFAAGLHLLADVSLLVERGFSGSPENPRDLSPAAKSLRESVILGKLIRNIRNMDFVKMSASTMPWFPRVAAHKRKISSEKAHCSHPLEPIKEDPQEEEEEEVEIKKRKKKENNNNNNNSPQGHGNDFRVGRGSASGMPEIFKEKIGELAGPNAIMGGEKLLIEKALTESDTKLLQGRLTMPERSMAERVFLTEEEKRLVRQKAAVGNRLEGIDVTLIDPLLGRWGVKLRRWNMEKGVGKRSSVSYAINDGWNKVLKALHWENGNGDGIVVQVWSIRVNGRLWVAVARP
ncbi:unnamed protein product [Cuscuta campestris]|uniref:Uncharacterized protein n=1 Tax=Cuscuta campestris TaxID=132261 RepID=A0A484K9X1_9ASTE|nr:unnamed protein product [Cuscuta campestris]